MTLTESNACSHETTSCAPAYVVGWVNQEALPLWGSQATGLTTSSTDMAHNFNVLRFGAPCLTRLAGGEVFVAFWCYEDCVSMIRWFKLGPK